MAGLADSVMTEMLTRFQRESVAGGEPVVSEGDPSDSVFVVISGRLKVVAEGPGGEIVELGELGPGQTFGEIGLISDEPRSATVFALRDSLLARLPRDAFTELLTRFPREITTHFVAPIIARLQGGSSRQPLQPRLCIAITPGGADVDHGDFAHRFAVALGRLGNTGVIDRAVVQRQLGEGLADTLPGDDVNQRVLLWLNAQERINDVTVYVTDPTSTGWTDRCARQADLVIVVGSGRSPLDPGAKAAANRVRSGPGVRRCWVLEHRPGTRPRDTARLLAATGVPRGYHLRQGDTADMERLARLVTGQGVGLVLSGGGARALAHIGVVQALRESAVPIDAVGAVSGGAIVAGQVALALPVEEIVRRTRESVQRIDYTLPVHALTRGRNWTSAMRMLFGDAEIEDLWLPFFSVATNLSLGREHEHASGSLMHAVRASTAIPALLPPVFEDGSVLVDGGLLNNLPVERMRNRPDIGRVIAVDVGSADTQWDVGPFDYEMSGWTSLVHRLAPWTPAPAVPPLSETLLRSISITNAATLEADRDQVDRYLRPPVHGFGLMEFSSIDRLVAAGLEYAQEAIAGWGEDPAGD